MAIDDDKIDRTVLALLQLTPHDNGRAWKAHDWDVLGWMSEKGMIFDPVSKAKSAVLTDEGWTERERLFKELFENESIK